MLEKSLQKSLERNKNLLIDKLISYGIYKINNNHLFELSLSDLEKEYNKISILY